MGARIDLNSDLGESFGRYELGQDVEMMEWITSANIACGFHAGDPDVMARTVRMAIEKGVAVGAHPGLPDLQGFGRREMRLSPEEVFHLMLYQIGALNAFVRWHGGRLHHVKPHGALYNMAAREPALAEAIAGAVRAFDPGLLLFALAGSELAKAGRSAGLQVAEEVFADRTYLPDGTLTPRGRPDAIIRDPEVAARRVVEMVLRGEVETVDGGRIPIRADTVCLHGDHPGAPAFAKAIRRQLEIVGITVVEAGVNGL
jgi:5-oxoprolinase (ATP-hydrolysing) subunit A